MKKQIVQFGIIIIILIICIAGYTILSGHYDKKEKKEKTSNQIVAFSLDDYKNTKSLKYTNQNETIELTKENGTWEIKGDSKTKVDGTKVESEMLSKLVEVIASEKIDKVSKEENYGFIKSDDNVAASTCTIKIVDSEGNEHTLYIGNSNPYDSDKYYMMVKGDDNVYIINSDLTNAFSKSKDDLKKEEETTTK